MVVKRVTVLMHVCERCGHHWLPRHKVVVTICPKCKSKLWDRPKPKKSK